MSGLRDRLEGGYAPTLAIALVALVPYIIVTSASKLYQAEIGRAVGLGETGLSLAASLATAGYAFGALLGGDVVNRFRKHRLFAIAAGAVAIGWTLAATATGPTPYFAGTVLQGFSTGVLLVVALPPTIQNFPWRRVPLTAVFINIALFGAVAAGPMVGGAIAAAHGWRWLYGGFAIITALAAAISTVVIPDEAPKEPGLRFDWPAMLLGIGATFLPFGGVALASAHGFAAPVVLVPLAIGIACFVALLLVEYHHDEPLAPIKRMWNTWPVIGTLIATFGGGAFVTLMELTVALDDKAARLPPLATAAMFWPQLLAVAVAAALLGTLFATRWLPVMILGGMISLIAGGAMLIVAGTPDHRVPMMVAVGLLGLGAGTTVAPGLFLAGMALKSRVLGRIVALVELVRSVGDFLIAPVMLGVAKGASGGGLARAGVAQAAAITLALAVATVLVCLGLYGAGGGGLPRPDLKRWLDEDGTAIDSPPLLARWR